MFVDTDCRVSLSGSSLANRVVISITLTDKLCGCHPWIGWVPLSDAPSPWRLLVLIEMMGERKVEGLSLVLVKNKV